MKQNEKKKRRAKLQGEKFVEKDYNPYDSSCSSHCLSELDAYLDDVEFEDDHSSTTCYLHEINNIIYGGFSTRFWMLRKHINSLNNTQLKDVPFFSWDCITLQLTNRDVNLVIRNEEDMNKLILLLVYKMQTIDG